MPTQLSREQVLHIAELAKLELSEEETAVFTRQLSGILDYAAKINDLDTDAIPPTAQAIPMRNVTRPDTIAPSLTQDEALGNAPDRRDDLVRVRAIFD